MTFVSKDQLPDGHDWFIAKQGCDDYVFMVDRECLTEQVLRDAWCAFVKLSSLPPIQALPMQGRPVEPSYTRTSGPRGP